MLSGGWIDTKTASLAIQKWVGPIDNVKNKLNLNGVIYCHCPSQIFNHLAYFHMKVAQMEPVQLY
jgi:hypothetical protein